MDKKIILWTGIGLLMIGAVSGVLTVTMINVLEWALAPFLVQEWRVWVETIAVVVVLLWANRAMLRLMVRRIADMV